MRWEDLKVPILDAFLLALIVTAIFFKWVVLVAALAALALAVKAINDRRK